MNDSIRKLSTKQSGALITLLLSVIVTFGYYSKVIFHPNDYMIASSHDGIKAYAVFAGHIKNDTSYHHFQNMAYPYGQVHVFTDGQTSIANALKFLKKIFPAIEDYSIGIFNLMMLFSFPLCSFFLYLIISRLRIPVVLCVLGSIAITFLSPQVFRMFNHPTLSYCFFIPFTWWMFIRFQESENRKVLWSLAIAIHSLFWFFIHPYYVMIAALFTGSIFALNRFNPSKFELSKLNGVMHFLLQVVAPVALSRVYVHLADHHEMRTSEPWGFWLFHAAPETVFVPTHAPFVYLFKIFGDFKQEWEGWAYIGTGALFLFILTLVRFIRYIRKKQWKKLTRTVYPELLRTAFWPSVITLLFSMCVPFEWGMHFLADWIPYVKQFRALGRFAWIFYYVFNVYALYLLYLSYRFFKIRKINYAAFSIVILYFVLFLVEAHVYQKEGRESSVTTPNYFNLTTLPAEYRELINNIESIKENYQAIIPLPFFMIGSEHFEKEGSDRSFKAGFVSSYWNNIPMLSSSAARSPIGEARNAMQFFGPPWFEKEIEKDLPDKKPFLLIYTKEALNTEEEAMLSLSQPLFSSDNYELRKLPYENVFKLPFDSLLARKWKLIPEGELVLKKTYEENTNAIAFESKGSLEGSIPGYIFMLEKDEYNFEFDKEYSLGFWYYNKGEKRNQVSVILELCDSQGNNCEWQQNINIKECMTINGDWSYIRSSFRLNKPDGKVAVFIYQRKGKSLSLFMDNFTITKN